CVWLTRSACISSSRVPKSALRVPFIDFSGTESKDCDPTAIALGRAALNPVGYLETGVIYCDENLRRLAQFPAECVDLIYLDPPFFSNKNYEVIWGDEAEVRSFEDRWEGGIEV